MRVAECARDGEVGFGRGRQVADLADGVHQGRRVEQLAQLGDALDGLDQLLGLQRQLQLAVGGVEHAGGGVGAERDEHQARGGGLLGAGLAEQGQAAAIVPDLGGEHVDLALGHHRLRGGDVLGPLQLPVEAEVGQRGVELASIAQSTADDQYIHRVAPGQAVRARAGRGGPRRGLRPRARDRPGPRNL